MSTQADLRAIDLLDELEDMFVESERPEMAQVANAMKAHLMMLSRSSFRVDQQILAAAGERCRRELSAIGVGA